jgi:hypothetical protein
MAHAFRYLIFALALDLWSAVRAEAQVQPEQRLRFTVFSPRPALGLAFTPRTGAAPQSFAFYPTARSPRYEFRGTMPLRIVEVESGKIVAEANVPPAISDALLILLPVEPTPSTGLRYRVLVLDDGATQQPAGSLAVINLSGLALSGSLGDQPIALTEGLNAPVAVSRAAKLVLRSPGKGRSVQAFASEISLSRNTRGLLLLLPPFYKNSLEVQSRLLIDAAPGPRL